MDMNQKSQSNNMQDRGPVRTQWPPSWLSDEPTSIAIVSSNDSTTEAAKPPSPAAIRFTSIINGTVCLRCHSRAFHEIPIHDGRSIRRDCASCGRFVAFSVWYGVPKFE